MQTTLAEVEGIMGKAHGANQNIKEGDHPRVTRSQVARDARLSEHPPETVRNARLPELYQNAKLTISECARIDECQDWANKMEALASYARQAADEELRKMADRIQARAIKRCGDLLREIESRPMANLKQFRKEGNHPSVSRTQAARDAGLSEHQQKTAIRVSRIPDDEFQEAIESDNPPTITALAERGKQSRLKAPCVTGKDGKSYPTERKQPSMTKTERIETIRDLTAKGFTGGEIASQLQISEGYTRALAREGGIRLLGFLFRGVRKIDYNRVVARTVNAAEALMAGLELIDGRLDDLDTTKIDEWIATLRNSVNAINRLITKLKWRAENVKQDG
jgi:hypothetical protein